jgi:hypothetical protein
MRRDAAPNQALRSVWDEVEPTMAVLAREHPVAGLDLPGFGRSGNPEHTLSLAELAETLARWLDARALRPAVGLVLNAPTMNPAHRTGLGQPCRTTTRIPSPR